MFTVEDYIEILAGVQLGGKFNLKKSDYSLISSLARQTFKGIAYTDRQKELAVTKIKDYQEEFAKNGFNITDDDFNNLRLPLRDIDRSRWIKVVDIVSGLTESPLIAVRFSFQKKLISALEKLTIKKVHYDKIKKIQYFKFNEKNLYTIVNAFKNKNFDMDDELLNYYNQIEKFTQEDCVPGVYGSKLKNLTPKAQQYIEKEIGKLTNDNILLYKDRSLKYGLEINHTFSDTNSLVYKIANRQFVTVNANSTKYPLDQFILTLEQLQRYPILIVLTQDTCYNDIVEAQQYLRNIIPNNEVSVTFRLDNNDEGKEFNQYIKQAGINNKVDNNTKIVYNLDNKIPKPLLASSWRPSTILVLQNNISGGILGVRKVVDCYPETDLVVYYTVDTITKGYNRYMNRDIEKI